MAKTDPSFGKAFLPGLIIGLIIGGIAGAVLPDLVAGPRIPPPKPGVMAHPAEPRDRERPESELVDPTDIPEQGERAPLEQPPVGDMEDSGG
ncbi:MAG: hypothetical protein Kow0022_18700 [Phycisphaerales bacterium]